VAKVLKRLAMTGAAALLAAALLGAIASGSERPESVLAQPADAELCVALRALEDSITALDGGSRQEYRAQFAAVRQDFQALRAAARGVYDNEVSAVGGAIDRFQTELDAWGEDGIVRSVLRLSAAAGGIAEAALQLNDAIDCRSRG
jgi:hypothetical protein